MPENEVWTTKLTLVWEFASRVSRRNSCDVTKYEKAKEVCVHAFSTPKRINFRVKPAECFFFVVVVQVFLIFPTGFF